MPTSDDREMIQVGPFRMSLRDYERLLEKSRGGHFLVAEAAYSVALDRDSRAQTVSIELTDEERERLEGDPGE